MCVNGVMTIFYSGPRQTIMKSDAVKTLKIKHAKVADFTNISLVLNARKAVSAQGSSEFEKAAYFMNHHFNDR